LQIPIERKNSIDGTIPSTATCTVDCGKIEKDAASISFLIKNSNDTCDKTTLHILEMTRKANSSILKMQK
jgi:hypothetical protein